MEKESNHEEIFKIQCFFLKKDNRTITFLELFTISSRSRRRLIVSYFERTCCQGTTGAGDQEHQGLPGLGMKELHLPGPVLPPPAVISSRKFIPALSIVGMEP